MFYYPNVLNHRTGCFATIWLAATKARKMNRRDLLKVNIQSTCTDIMDYVLVRVPPLAAGLPRPRFSLYLSSQLQYGIILVFHRQCQLLLEEIQEAIDRLHRHRVQVQIDMLPEELRQTQTLPDALALLTETEGARDPFFGSIEFGLPSPSSLMQLAEEMGVVYPERPVSPPSEGITVSQESITITEREPVIMPEPEFEGAELQEADMIEMLLEQSDQFPEGEDEREREAEQARQREGRERETERERWIEEEVVERERERAVAEVERTRDLTGSTIIMEPAQTTEVPSRDIISLLEEVEPPAAMPQPAERERTPEPVPIPPSPPSPERRRERGEESRRLEEELVPIPEAPTEGPRRRRKRQLVFMDEEIQISQDALQTQINDPSIETRSLDEVLIRAPSQVSEPKVLLSNPCMKLPPEILELWKQGAVVHHTLPSKRRREAEEEDLEAVRERERGREEHEEGELREMPTEIVESGISRYDTPVSSLGMEVTDREVSPMETPEIRRSPIAVSVCGLEDIPEERVPELEDIAMETDPLRRMGAIGEDKVTFHSLLPPGVRRRTIAQAFWRLLERIDMKEVTVQQDEPYGDIIIISLSQQL
ncbi:meiotic recombination protein REC8 homolog isoform X1 [Clarias gariepinus]|uniref:meiotic recombination protein REC8 homolog isoform X1 n=2 Tax=Clarias gariepinus TaxID=13013 RepID=UPI00234DFE6F|nr:meiotic recombination protein REC8 homolog isoform X1 [Clarias gariepinus]